MDQRTSRVSPGKRDRLIEHFVAGTTARAAAELVGVPRHTAMLFYQRLRRVIVEELTKASPLSGAVEVSEAPPSKLGGIFQMRCLITFAHSSPQQAEGYPALLL